MAINTTLSNLSTLNNTSILGQVNQNFANIQTALGNALSTNGQSPNQMQTNLDMNNSQILNLPPPGTMNSPARLVDVASNPTITVPPTGTSGGVVPFLNGNNTWSGTNTYSGGGGIAFTQSGTGAVTRTLDAKIKEYAVSVIDFGADPTGVSDSTTAIQNAINSLPASGGEVIFPIGLYSISSTLNIGNGNSSTASTTMGVLLRGVGSNLIASVFPGYNQPTGPILSWAGSTNQSMVKINGPLYGWGVQNIFFKANNVAGTVGLNIISASAGNCKNLSFDSCFRSIASTTVAPFGAFSNTNCFYNRFEGTCISVPGQSGAMGIVLTGASGSTADTSENTFINTSIFLAESVVTVYGIYCQYCDANTFLGTHLFGGNPSGTSVVFDYTVAAGFPNSNIFYNIDPFQSGGGASFANTGTPPTGTQFSNIAYILTENGATDPGIANFVVYTPNGTLTTSASLATVHTTSYAQLGSDSSIIFFLTGSNATLTMLNPTQVPGRWLWIKCVGTSGAVNSATANVVPFAGGAASTALLSGTGKWAALQSDGSFWQIMMSN